MIVEVVEISCIVGVSKIVEISEIVEILEIIGISEMVRQIHWDKGVISIFIPD